jgi:hypothetical protein
MEIKRLSLYLLSRNNAYEKNTYRILLLQKHQKNGIKDK